MSDKLSCVIPDCHRVRATRGLCWNCYQSARTIIKTGSESWKSLEEKGVCLPKKKRALHSPFGKALEEANSKKETKDEQTS